VVHSLKDLPTDLPDGVSIGAIPEREDPRDVLIGRKDSALSLDTLPPGSRVGTSSLRRQALLRALRPELAVQDLRGNLDTRIRKVDEGEIDAIVVAAAGVIRLGLRDRVSQYLEIGSWLPAPGQGAIAVVVRADDVGRSPWLRALDHPPTRAATLAERTLLASLDAGCRMPVAALGVPFGAGLRLSGLVAAPDGTRAVRAEGTGTQDDPSSLGLLVGDRLLARGADLLLDPLRQSNHTGD
jgi:hydroxymethylbilane synthase